MSGLHCFINGKDGYKVTGFYPRPILPTYLVTIARKKKTEMFASEHAADDMKEQLPSPDNNYNLFSLPLLLSVAIV